MKKVISLLLTLLLAVMILNITKVIAEKEDEFDAYVRDNFYEIASTCGVDPSDLTVYEGIELINLRDEGRFYPIYENGELVYCLEVYKVNGELGFAFPGNAIDAIEQLFEVNNKEFAIFAVKDRFYGFTGDHVVDFRANKLIKPEDFVFDVPEVKEYTHKIIEFIGSGQLSQTEGADSIMTSSPSWTTYFRSAGLGYGCVPQVLYNIYRNYGKSISSWTTVGSEMNTANGLTLNPYYMFSHSQIQTYLTWKSVSTTYSSTSGKLAYNTCDSILSGGKFIMMVSKGTYYDDYGSLQTSYHATALVGTPSSAAIKIADPHGNSATSSISYGSASFYSSSIYYTWNSGYYSHLTY